MPGCKPLSKLTRPLLAGVFTLLLPLLFARPAGAQMSSAECGTDNLIANRLPSAQQDVHGDARLATDNKAAPEGAQWDAPGTGHIPGHPGRHGHVRPRRRPIGVGVHAAGGRQRQLQGLRRDREHAVGVQAAHRDRERRQRRPRAAHAPGPDRSDRAALRPHRRAAGRRVVFNLRVPGLLPGAAHQARKRFADGLLGFAVERGGRFIQ